MARLLKYPGGHPWLTWCRHHRQIYPKEMDACPRCQEENNALHYADNVKFREVRMMERSPKTEDQLPVVAVPIGKSLTISAEEEREGVAKYLDAEVIRERLVPIPGGQDRMLITTFWMSGIRVSEGLLLKKQDIDFQNYTARITWLKSRKHRVRIIPLHPKLRDLLQLYTARMNGPDVIFPITRQRAWQICEKWMQCSPHQLRHSFAVHYLRSGGLLVNLHRLLGHSDIRVTMEYQKIVPKDLGRELQTIPF